MACKEDYIAVFDSGVGGISVLRQLHAIMPQERFLYYGDSANAPYGTRPTEQVRQLVLEVAQKLMDRNVKALVVACNTATAAAIDLLRETWPDRIIVGIEPALKLAARQYPGGTVGVLATPVTLREEKFRHLVEATSNHCQVVPLPAPGLVELVEHGKADSDAARQLLAPLLQPWVGKLDALVLGCTHYPFARNAISDTIGKNVTLLDGGEGTAQQTRRRLEEQGLLFEGPGEILWENSLEDAKMPVLCRQLFSQP